MLIIGDPRLAGPPRHTEDPVFSAGSDSGAEEFIIDLGTHRDLFLNLADACGLERLPWLETSPDKIPTTCGVGFVGAPSTEQDLSVANEHRADEIRWGIQLDSPDNSLRHLYKNAPL